MKALASSDKEQWLGFAEKLIVLAYAIFAEAKVDITEKLFGEPKILSLALLSRTIGNFKGVISVVKENLIVEARTLTRSCYENLYCMAALIEQGDDFVQVMHLDQMRSFRSQGEILLQDVEPEQIGSSEFVDQLRAHVQRLKDDWPKAKYLTPQDAAERSVLKRSYTIYKKLSGYAAHPSILALRRHLVKFVENGEQVMGIDVNPPDQKGELLETLDLACNAMIGACVATNQILGHLPGIKCQSATSVY
ncbi:MAG: DUF5677 domain-containing protein [Xanthobacteraceae bacterium]